MFEKIKKVFSNDASSRQIEFEPIPNQNISSINPVQTEEMSFEDYGEEVETIPTLNVNVEKDYDPSTISGVNKYRDLCDYAGYKWGISPNLVTAMICQESRAGVLSDNLFQIEFDTNKGEVFTAYNFIDKKYENIVLTDNPADYYGKGYICITREDLQNPKTNISVGTAMLASRAQKMNYHIPSTIQSYNFGVTRTNNALNIAGDKASQQLDQTNVEFMKYNNHVNQVKRNDGTIKQVGNPNYFNDVMRFLDLYDGERGNDTITIKHMSNGEIVESSLKIAY